MIRYKYLKDDRHFITFINKIVRESGVNIPKESLLPREFYIENIYVVGLAENYTWELRDDPKLITEERTLDWLSKQKTDVELLMPEIPENIHFTEEFIDTLNDLENEVGVYSFWTENDVLLYVGRSVNLQSRITTSFQERLMSYGKPVYLRYVCLDSPSDASILEVNMICKLKPALNRKDKYDDVPELGEKEFPKLSKKILIYEKGHKQQ